VIPPAAIGAMSSNRVILGQLLSSRARLRFPGRHHPATTTPARRDNLSERHTGTSQTVSLHGVNPPLRGLSSPQNRQIIGKSLITRKIMISKSWRSETSRLGKIQIEKSGTKDRRRKSRLFIWPRARIKPVEPKVLNWRKLEDTINKRKNLVQITRTKLTEMRILRRMAGEGISLHGQPNWS
jgi:hypothetical protein